MNVFKKGWFRMLLLLAVAAIVGWRFLGTTGAELAVPTAEVQQGSLDLQLTEVGELKAERSATIAAPNDKLIKYLAPEGSWVKEGDLLVQLESEKYRIGVQEAESALHVAEAQLQKAIADRQAQVYKEQGAKQNYESLLGLKEKGFAMESEVEESRLAYMELQSKTSSYEAAVNQERSKVDQARNALEEIKHKLSANAVYAPQDGLVVYAYVGRAEEGKKVEVGMIPYEGQALMELPDISSMTVDTEVNEMDVQKVKVGQQVSIRLDAIPNVTFKGEVAKIGSLARHKVSKASGRRTGVKVFNVIVKVKDIDERLRPGLSASVSILINEFEQVTYAPVEAIFNSEGRTVAWVQRGRKAEQVVVECGNSNDKFVIIHSGLEPGDKVLLAEPS
jgi:RND family efflux transporter MFP subunit